MVYLFPVKIVPLLQVYSMSIHELGSKNTPLQITEGMARARAARSKRCSATRASRYDMLTITNARLFFSLDEAAVYDRQIRLWGLEAQQRSVFIVAFAPQERLDHNRTQDDTSLGCAMQPYWLYD